MQGIYNVAGDGLLPWSEVAAICGKRTFPLPPFGTRAAVGAADAGSGVDLPPELLDLLRYGRGVDNRRLKRGRLRLPLHVGRHRRRLRGGAAPPPDASAASETAYQYERDVEQFFRHSPAVVRDDA